MADAELHIVVKEAGDPAKLAELLNSAVAMQKKEPVREVPAGYRCVECYAYSGGHENLCSFKMIA